MDLILGTRNSLGYFCGQIMGIWMFTSKIFKIFEPALAFKPYSRQYGWPVRLYHYAISFLKLLDLPAIYAGFYVVITKSQGSP